MGIIKLTKRLGRCLLAHLVGAVLFTLCAFAALTFGVLLTEPSLLSDESFISRIPGFLVLFLIVSFGVTLLFIPITWGIATSEELTKERKPYSPFGTAEEE